MRDPFVAGVGGILSADIAVPEHERELRFYSRVLTTGREPLWRDDLMDREGTPVIGLGERTPEYESLPLQWMPHIQVSDVGASAARALEGGGTELMHARGEDGRSQWAVLVDPAGAAFGLIPVVDDLPEASGSAARPGRIAGLTLVVPDVASACAFYEQVVGWSAAAADAEGARELRRPDGGPAATIRPAGGDHDGIPPAWILGLSVGDLEQSLQRAREEGGEVVHGAVDTGHAIVRDPVGAFIGLQAEA